MSDAGRFSPDTILAPSFPTFLRTSLCSLQKWGCESVLSGNTCSTGRILFLSHQHPFQLHIQCTQHRNSISGQCSGVSEGKGKGGFLVSYSLFGREKALCLDLATMAALGNGLGRPRPASFSILPCYRVSPGQNRVRFSMRIECPALGPKHNILFVKSSTLLGAGSWSGLLCNVKRGCVPPVRSLAPISMLSLASPLALGCSAVEEAI